MREKVIIMKLSPGAAVPQSRSRASRGRGVALLWVLGWLVGRAAILLTFADQNIA